VIIVVLDINYFQTTNGTGFKFDLISDLVGSIIVYVGVIRISKYEVLDFSYRYKMRFVIFAASSQILLSIFDFAIHSMPGFMTSINNLLSILMHCAFIVFCITMATFSEERALGTSRIRWGIARRLFLWLNLITTGVYAILNELYSLGNNPSYSLVTVGGFGLVLVFIMMFIPLIYFLTTIHQMKKEIVANYY